MKWNQRIALLLTTAAAGLLLSGCGTAEKDLLLHLSFDEGSGTTVSDSSGHLPDTELNYLYTNAVYMDDQDPQWRDSGVEGGSLLFDGNSTYISYNKQDLAVEGNCLTISVWVAPRTFEWDDPNAVDNGTELLTGLVSQFSKSSKKGFVLGYERHGRLTFQIGSGKDWFSLWSDEGPGLTKYAWNQVTATFDGGTGTMSLYLNGQLLASREVPPGTSIAAANTGLLVGRSSEAEHWAASFINVHSGLMDELKLYSRALTAEEISGSYGSVAVPEIPYEEIGLQNILTGDVQKPQYHGGPYQFWMNEPHAPVYYNGVYHLFFQQNMQGSYWRNIAWGHLVSDDMVHWREIKQAVTPTYGTVVPDGVWSGTSTLDANGIPLLFFTAGNDSFREVEGLISNQNIGVAYPADLSDPNLTDWIICDALAVVQREGQGRTGEFRDPHIWKEGDTWCMLACSGSTQTSGGTALLYTTDTLELQDDGTVAMDWQYRGPVYEMENPSPSMGTSWELPVILPVTNESGTVHKYFFVFSPAPATTADNKIYYFVGDFDLETGRFTPDESFGGQPRILDFGANVFTGPSAFIDPVSGDVVMFSIMQDQRSPAEEGAAGWAHNVGLARRIYLSEDGSDLCVSPIDAIQSLEREPLVDAQNLTLEQANDMLAGVDEDMLYIEAVFAPQDATSFGLAFKQSGDGDESRFTYNVSSGRLTGSTTNRGEDASAVPGSGQLSLQKGRLTMRVYIDRSLVEGFFNDDKALTLRCYPEDPANAQGLSVFADGAVTLERLYVASMGSIYE